MTGTEGPATGAPSPAPRADVVVDARGLLCPAPVIRLARAAREHTPGTVLTVLATDPAAALDVPAWARMRGHTVVPTPETSREPEEVAAVPEDALVVVSVRLG
ncbi:sulfurtransferase TusA family protein [Cellulomonas soli]|uniref:UPF0033 domain-containing protein n=1 Tax=Cellulomonas soli TaxID=931535 RepID=A0A512P9R0_9CELL|nr:sulfurtransferase TusA family protein [Cellulomonas soli]NYI60417.1 TusA-related sulfurtransferase [Cellulomonas soli]GEP67930.1 hypothetical protein CSO01_06450 [Cellulomonas soli]